MVKTYLRSIFKLKRPSFTKSETLVSNSYDIEEPLISCSSIWITCAQGYKRKNIDDFKIFLRSYNMWNCSVQFPDSRDYCVCSFTNNLYFLGKGQ